MEHGQQRLCPDRTRAALAMIAAVLLLVAGGAGMQVAGSGDRRGRGGGNAVSRDRRGAGIAGDAGRFARRAGWRWRCSWRCWWRCRWPERRRRTRLLALAGIFYKAGALVFGGGHVVLPLLRDALVPTGWLSDNAFLAGYGVAQAVPGPLFTFSAYLGAVVAPAGSALLWSAVALVFMFLPGLLLALAGLPLWAWLVAASGRTRRAGGSQCRGGGGAGGGALRPDLGQRGRPRRAGVAIAVAGFPLLERWRAPPLPIVILCVGAALVSAFVA